MEIITTEDGKDYLTTYIAKIDNHTIDANAMFIDVEDTIKKILKAYNNAHKTKNTVIYDGYGSNLQALANRYNGDYFSPSFMKGYQSNPALMLMQNFFTEQANDATAIGTTFHKIMEEYYKLPMEERNREKLWDIETKVMLPGQDKDVLDTYIKGYIESGDYLDPKKPLDDTTLKCVTEHKGRANLHIKSIDYTLPCAVSFVADRVDYRGDDVVILDYKTGHPTSSAATFDGYLGSMILYKWAMEQELNTTINKGYLVCPGNADVYMPLDYSKENEEKLAQSIDRFYRAFMRGNRTREYEFTDDGYFTTDDSRKFKEIMKDNTLWMCKIPIKIYIGEHNESCL